MTDIDTGSLSFENEIVKGSGKNYKPDAKFAGEILKILDKKIVGQELAKQQLSLLISMFLNWDHKKSPRHAPPNAMVIGPSGSGKTFSFEVIEEELDLPSLIIDATTLSPNGAREGTNVGSIPNLAIKHASGSDRCIVFLDEFDKLTSRPHVDRNAYWKEDIQRGLLKVIEGQSNTSPADQGNKRVPKMYFALGGAFTDISKQDKHRSPETNRMLRNAPRDTIVAEDFINFGFIRELVARIPAQIKYEALPFDFLVDILKHPVSSPLIVWKNHFENIGKSVTFTEDFYQKVAKRAFDFGLGARGLQQVVFASISARAFKYEGSKDDKIVIDADLLQY
ncbi:AAA family ATPase [uncultured Hoeflea sp.]|uniref:AAA family ATPase n=1 Tax=uncultured Hoeflea sp. TaxID=538666 RepID=UPI00260F1690|nr:AAA family ATPase [uncultured Hoeflea sp.]